MAPWIRYGVVSTIFVCAITVAGRALAQGDLVEVAKLTASDASFTYGRSVSLDGSVAICGAPSTDSNRGAAYISRHDGVTWTEEQKLVASDAGAGHQFGGSVSIDGDVALIGAEFVDGGMGAAYVFRFDGSTWTEEQKLTGSGAFNFGVSVSLDGNTALVGAPGEDFNAGAVYVFRFDGSTWALQQKLTASDGAADDRFGGGVSLHGDLALCGAAFENDQAGSAYVFRFDGATWTEEQKLVASDGDDLDFFGFAVAIEADAAVIGSMGDDDRGEGAGAAYVYRFDGTTWIEEQKLTASDGKGAEQFGSSVALDGDAAVVGAFIDDDFGFGAGSAYTFRYDGSTWTESQKLIASDASASDAFGKSVALSDGVVLAGASGDDGSTGSAYVFGADCRRGTVNLANGFTIDVLYVNGSNGGQDRAIDTMEGDLLSVTLLKPVAGGNGKFVLHGNEGEPDSRNQVPVPFDIGVTCFPVLFSAGASPVIVGNNIGKPGQVGASHFFGVSTEDPDRASTTLLLPALPFGTAYTFQGIIVDSASTSSKGVSVTNAVTVRILR